MRRTISILTATVGGLALLLTFKTTALHAPTPLSQSVLVPASTAPRRAAGTAPHPVTGPVVQTKFGPVQVKATLAGSHISDVQALQLPGDFALSQQISNYAGPALRSEAIRAQSAQIDVVSGATYTSEGYQRSLQAALDSAHG